MVIGARQRDIRNQFLLKALMLSVIGGIIGIVVGLLGRYALTQGLGFPFVFSVIAIVIAFGVSIIVGISFGLSLRQCVPQSLIPLLPCEQSQVPHGSAPGAWEKG